MSSRRRRFQLTVTALALISAAAVSSASAAAQTNPVPLINHPLVPETVVPGGAGFTLTVNGTGFVSGSVVNWNSTPRATTFVSSSQLTATILASDVSSAGTASVTVTNPSPGGGLSNVVCLDATTTISPIVFGSSTSYGTGVHPVAQVAEDFNGDGKVDLAVANALAATVSILLGNGDGTFQSNVDYATGTEPLAVATGDFNGDGKLDLAVVDDVAIGLVSVLLGNGNGTFLPHADYASGGALPDSIAVEDFNGDGKLDLAVANTCGTDPSCNGPGTVSILLGNGDGTFQSPVSYAVTALAYSVVAGDFNSDNKLDLAVADSFCNSPSCGAGFASVLLGNGDGTFQAQVDYGVGTGPFALTAADLNGDGKLDLAVSNFWDSTVSVLLGKGNGTFQPAVNYSTGTEPLSVTTGDFNGDGKLDLATTDGPVSILLGNGNGSFQAPISTSQTNAMSVAARDFNRDGRLDLAGAANGLNSVTVLLQTAGPVASLSPTSLTFSTQLEGTVSAKQDSTLSNTGNASLSISSTSVSGDFGQTNTCGGSVGVGANCTISVAFDPKGKGTLTGNVSIADNAPGSPQTISLTGTGTAVKLSPTSLDFGSVKVGKTGTPQSVTLTNVAPYSALAIGRVTFLGRNPSYFAQTNTCGTSVPPGASCTFSVTFTPTTKGFKQAILNIFDSGGASPQTVIVSGTGT